MTYVYALKDYVAEHRRISIAAACTAALLIAAMLPLLPLRGAPERPERVTAVEIKRAYSEQTVKIEPDEKLLYAGICAPEEGDPLFEQSKARNEELVGGKTARVRFDEVERDRKGRLIGYVFTGDSMVNEQLVREGLAFLRLTPEMRRYADRLLAAQAEARKARRGLWANLPRSAEPRYPADPKYGQFHRPSCEEVPKINPERLVVLKNRGEAFEQGFAPCSTCHP